MTEDNTEYTKNAIIQKKYKKYSIFVKNADVSKNCEDNIIFARFSKTTLGT